MSAFCSEGETPLRDPPSSYFTEKTPKVAYPQGFQGTSIPVYGPNVASIIEKRIAGEL